MLKEFRGEGTDEEGELAEDELIEQSNEISEDDTLSSQDNTPSQATPTVAPTPEVTTSPEDSTIEDTVESDDATPTESEATETTTSSTADLEAVGSSSIFPDYTTYYSPFLSYYIDVPMDFTIVSSENSQVTFSDGISEIVVDGYANLTNLTADNYLEQYGSNVLYSFVGDNFYIESDFTDNGDIRYQYVLITEPTVVGFSITYPESQRTFFDEALIIMITSLMIQP